MSRRGRTCAVVLSLEAYDELPARETLEVVEEPKFRICRGTEATQVFDAIKAGCPHVDAIVEATGLEVQHVQAALLELELNGRINPARLGGQLSVRCAGEPKAARPGRR